MKVIETERLQLRWLHSGDAAFMLELVNEPSWLENIGDRGVQSLQDAVEYIQNGPVDMYARLGFGMYLVELKDSHAPIGLCGLIKRDSLEDVDIGFALSPAFWRQGYAYEAAFASLLFARDELGLGRVVAITSKGNDASGKLLEKLGFCPEGLVPAEEDGEQLKLYAISFRGNETGEVKMPSYHLAQLNIAEMRYPVDAPEMADFVANLDRVNALADAAPGFVWRLQTEEGDATGIKTFGEDVLINMSVWKDVESLHNYVYRSVHAQIMSRRKEWFERVQQAYTVLWWIPEGSEPSLEEARARLDKLRSDGPGADAFTFKHSFPAPRG